ncbi:MAG: hypothetical protein K2Z80_24180, partial [Xanthobacteraceae bacterium]|nr:hypothetical protein [Xanthobacteraceae bacterium]
AAEPKRVWRASAPADEPATGQSWWWVRARGPVPPASPVKRPASMEPRAGSVPSFAFERPARVPRSEQARRLEQAPASVRA